MMKCIAQMIGPASQSPIPSAPTCNCALWVAVNERDEIGSDLVPDYMTSVQDGGFYGWPYSYYGQTVDARVEPQRPDLVAKAIKPDTHSEPIRYRWD